MIRRSRAVTFAAMVASAMVMCSLSAVSQQDSPPKLKDGFDVNALDSNVDPCVDFYRYACGKWLAQNPVPPDRSIYGRSSELLDRNQAILRETLETNSAPDAGRSANEQKIGDYYASCMDESAIERKGTSALEPELALVNGLREKGALPVLMAHFSLVGTNALFGFGVQQDAKDSTQQIAALGQGGLGLPDRDFYFRDDPKSAEIREQYVRHAQNMFELFGENPKQAESYAQVAMRVESTLAQGSLDRVARRDPNKVYHKMSVAELQALTPAFDWSRFMTQLGMTGASSLNVSEPEFLRTMQ